ncbi:MAG: hypothetical protein HY901_12215 [Deltaproteobacteria bacterium]|nr:hypothetical protein [Deltaproteobacteria bacterium]
MTMLASPRVEEQLGIQVKRSGLPLRFANRVAPPGGRRAAARLALRDRCRDPASRLRGPLFLSPTAARVQKSVTLYEKAVIGNLLA